MKLELLSTMNINPIETGFRQAQHDNEKSVPADVFGFGIPINTQKNVSEKAVNEAVKKVNKVIEGSNTTVEFSVHKETHEIMVTLKDKQTGEVIKQIPSKKMLDLAAYMQKLAGMIVDEKA